MKGGLTSGVRMVVNWRSGQRNTLFAKSASSPLPMDASSYIFYSVTLSSRDLSANDTRPHSHAAEI